MFTFLALVPAHSSETKAHKKESCTVYRYSIKCPLSLRTDNFQTFPFLTLPRNNLYNFLRIIYSFWLFWCKETINVSSETGIVLQMSCKQTA